MGSETVDFDLPAETLLQRQLRFLPEAADWQRCRATIVTALVNKDQHDSDI
jgi:hypothetical protein